LIIKPMPPLSLSLPLTALSWTKRSWQCSTLQRMETRRVARDKIAAVLDFEDTGVEAPALDLDLDLDKDKKNNAKKSKRRPAVLVIPKIETSAITS